MQTNLKSSTNIKKKKKCVGSGASVLARLSVRLQVKMSFDGQLTILQPSLFGVFASPPLLFCTVAMGNSH